MEETKKETMTAAQIKELRKFFGLIQKNIKTIMPVYWRTWQNWERGLFAPLPVYNDMLWDIWDNKEKLKKQLDKKAKVK